MTILTKWATTVTIKRFIKKIDTEFALLTLSCFKSFLFMSSYYCQSHCWNNTQTPSLLFVVLTVLLFCPWMRKPCFFLHFAVNWHIQLVIVWHNKFSIDGSCFVDTNFEKLLLCNVFVCTFCMCYLLHFFRLWSIRQKKKHCQRQSSPRVEFCLWK